MIFFMEPTALWLNDPNAAIGAAIGELVTGSRLVNITFVNLPMIFPSGSAVTVKIEQVSAGYRVSDSGFAYRELKSIGAERWFGRVSSSIAEQEQIERNRRVIYVDVAAHDLARAICDVGTSSWQIVNKIFSDLEEEEQSELATALADKLVFLFGDNNVHVAEKLRGSSSSEWDFSAVVHLDSKIAAFQAVSNHAGSIYRTNSAFHDLAAMPKPPTLVAVVRDKTALGARLSLLSQAGRVIPGRSVG